MKDFEKDEMLRYSRHFSLDEVGLGGQHKLKQAKVIVIGAGGLANSVLLYLAAAGVGTLGLVDDDVVDSSNLQRQIMFAMSDINKSKVDMAKNRIKELNPFVKVKTYNEALTEVNARNIIEEYDIVVDCTDNFPTRYLVNDACWHLNKPNVYASISQFDGQCTVFTAEDGPCYRCLYSEAPPAGLMPNCAEGGVLGALPGLLGTIQAMQVLTLILNIGSPLVGRLLMVDALNFHFKELAIEQDPNCVLCVEHTAFEKLKRPEKTCAIQPTDVPEVGIAELKKLQKSDAVFLLDVREPYEYSINNMGGYLIPLKELPTRLNELDAEKQIVVHCKSGMRSAKAVQLLKQANINAKSLRGGIEAWDAILAE